MTAHIMMLGAVNNMALITEYGKEVGRQCKEMGIQVNFAPDMILLPLNHNGFLVGSPMVLT